MLLLLLVFLVYIHDSCQEGGGVVNEATRAKRHQVAEVNPLALHSQSGDALCGAALVTQRQTEAPADSRMKPQIIAR